MLQHVARIMETYKTTQPLEENHGNNAGI